MKTSIGMNPKNTRPTMSLDSNRNNRKEDAITQLISKFFC